MEDGQIWLYLSYGFGIFAIIMLLLAIVLFFVLKIYKVFMDITGISAKRGVREIEENVDFTNQLNRKKHAKAKEKRKLTKKEIMTPTGQINFSNQENNNAPVPPAFNHETETSVLGAGDEAETQLLSNVQPESEAETQVLSNVPELDGTAQGMDKPALNIRFDIVREVILIHTEEVI